MSAKKASKGKSTESARNASEGKKEKKDEGDDAFSDAEAFGESLMDMDLEATFETWRFNGFNPKNFWKVLRGVAVENGIDDAKFQEDMINIIAFTMERGTAWQRGKVQKQSSALARSTMTEIIQRYSILVTKKPDGPEDITFARIVACQPILVSTLLMKGFGRIVAVELGLPAGLSFPQASSIIPQNNPMLFGLFLCWTTKFTTITNGMRAGLDELKVSARSFAKIGHRSDFVAEEKRAAHVRKVFTKIVADGKPMPTVASVLMILAAGPSNADLFKGFKSTPASLPGLFDDFKFIDTKESYAKIAGGIYSAMPESEKGLVLTTIGLINTYLNEAEQAVGVDKMEP